MDRAPIDEMSLTERQREVYDQIVSGPRGRVQGPLRVWLHTPDFAERAQALGAYCRYGTRLPQRLSELAIITTGAFWRAAFEWYAHAPLAIEAGVDAATVEAIRLGETPIFARGDEAIVFAFARELLEAKRVSAGTYQRAVDTLGLEGVIELVGIIGYYGLISLTINAFEVPLPPDAAEPFEDERICRSLWRSSQRRSISRTMVTVASSGS
jgi:4-carboxymuconolactone decarboxylase